MPHVYFYFVYENDYWFIINRRREVIVNRYELW